MPSNRQLSNPTPPNESDSILNQLPWIPSTSSRGRMALRETRYAHFRYLFWHWQRHGMHPCRAFFSVADLTAGASTDQISAGMQVASVASRMHHFCNDTLATKAWILFRVADSFHQTRRVRISTAPPNSDFANLREPKQVRAQERKR